MYIYMYIRHSTTPYNIHKFKEKERWPNTRPLGTRATLPVACVALPDSASANGWDPADQLRFFR